MLILMMNNIHVVVNVPYCLLGFRRMKMRTRRKGGDSAPCFACSASPRTCLAMTIKRCTPSRSWTRQRCAIVVYSSSIWVTVTVDRPYQLGASNVARQHRMLCSAPRCQTRKYAQPHRLSVVWGLVQTALESICLEESRRWCLSGQQTLGDLAQGLLLAGAPHAATSFFACKSESNVCACVPLSAFSIFTVISFSVDFPSVVVEHRRLEQGHVVVPQAASREHESGHDGDGPLAAEEARHIHREGGEHENQRADHGRQQEGAVMYSTQARVKAAEMNPENRSATPTPQPPFFDAIPSALPRGFLL